MSAITLPGDGQKVATTTNASSEHVQKLQLMRSDDANSFVTADANGQKVQLGAAIPAGMANIGDVDVLTVPADPFGVNADAASATGSISAKLRAIAATGIPVTSVVPGTGATSLGKAIGGTAGATDTAVPSLGIRDDALSTLSDAEGKWVPWRVDSQGRIWVRSEMVDPATGNPLTFTTDLLGEQQPTIDAGAYSDGDCLSAILTFADAVAKDGGMGYIDHLQIIDHSNTGGTGKNMLVTFFRSSIASPPAKNAAFTLTDAQCDEVACRVATADASWYSMGGSSIAEVAVSPPIPYKVATGTSLFALVKLLGAFTFGATNDVIIRPHFMRS